MEEQERRLEHASVLVVEDQQEWQQIAQDALSQLGCPDIRVVATVQQARQALLERPVDVVLIDCSLDGPESGVDLSIWVLAQLPPPRPLRCAWTFHEVSYVAPVFDRVIPKVWSSDEEAVALLHYELECGWRIHWQNLAVALSSDVSPGLTPIAEPATVERSQGWRDHPWLRWLCRP
jgi:hypothetical protein